MFNSILKKIRKFSFIIIILFSAPVMANLPDIPLQFPRDHAAHYANVPYPVTNMTEWWYYNGKINTNDGRHFSYSVVTFNIITDVLGFKIVVPVLMVQLTDIDQNKVYGNSILYSSKDSNYSTNVLNIKLGKKDLVLQDSAGVQILNSEIKSKQGSIIKLSLQLTPTGKELVEGKDGLVPVGTDNNAYYYAYTRLSTLGSMQVDNETFTIDSSQSSSWVEHVWGDFMISPRFPWMFSNIRLDNGVDINLVDMLDLKTKLPTDLNHANVRMPDGSNTYYTTGITVTQTEERPYPRRYEITIKSANIHLYLESLADGQDVNGWWEGISKVEGTYNGKPISGFSYVQITSQRK